MGISLIPQEKHGVVSDFLQHAGIDAYGIGENRFEQMFFAKSVKWNFDRKQSDGRRRRPCKASRHRAFDSRRGELKLSAVSWMKPVSPTRETRLG